jgi:hypothetical protein
MAIEEPSYVVKKKTDDYEIRNYSSYCVAETVIQDDFEDSGSKAFRILADYIFGNNRSKTKIAMTAPVTQSPKVESEKIAMTAPVSQSKTTSGYQVQFVMPAGMTLETLPEPVDSRVKLRQIPARKVAVFSYSGSWSEERYQEKLTEFQSILKRDGIKTQGEPEFARFNSPFMIWFLRRNEIWLSLVP